MLRLLHYQRSKMNNNNSLRKRDNPLVRANFLSKVTYFYMFKIMGVAAHHDLTEEDTFEVLAEHKSSMLGKKLEIYWNEEMKRHKKYALHRALYRMFGTRYMLLGIFKLLEELALVLVMPMSIEKIVTYFEKNQTTVSTRELYIYSSAVIVTLYVNAIFSHFATFHLLHISMKMRIACSSLMYRKALKLSKSSIERTTVGNIITMLSSDVGKFEQGFFLSHFVWIAPILTFVALYLLYRQINLSAVWGIIFLFVFIPVQVLLGNMTSAKRMKIAQRTDERVRLMHELLTGVQAIKMYCWEKPFSTYVKNARRQEMGAIRSHSYLIGLLYSLEFFITRASVFISLVVYVLIGNRLAPQKIFVVTAIYNVIKPAVTIVFAMSMAALFSVNVALKRIEKFLRNEDYVVDPPGFTSNNLRNIDPRDLESNQVSLPIQPRVVVRGVSAKWLDTSDEVTLKNLNFDICSGELVAIIGPVGSGKSSLLNVLLREMIVTSGEVDIQGRISYASQEPWFFSGSIQQNILFGETYDASRYGSVTHVCALLNDFDNFPHGDASLVGERGKSLSGGQKARVNLARCIYRKADIYILDDPLSAVDSRIGRHLYQKCIETFLRDKICILVTHQLQYLKTADKIIIMKDGSIEASGTFEELQESGLDFAKMLESIQAEIEGKESKNIEKGEERKSVDLPHIEKEKVIQGIVDLSTYWSYLRAGGNYFFIAILIFLIIISHVTAFGGDYFVAYWVNLEQVKVVQPRIAFPKTIERTKIISIYAILLGCTAVTAMWFCLYYASFFVNASRKLHEMIFDRLMQATMSFFSKNSVGKILNRFAKDLALVDEHIPIVLLEVILIGCFVFGIFLLSTIVEPYLIIPLLVLFTGIYFFRRFYIRTSRGVKRLESVARSPILGHMTSSLEGLPTIRCFNMEENLIEEFDRLQDIHSSSWFLFLASSRCFGFWLDIFCFTFVAISIYFMLLLSSGMNGGNIGLVITQYIGLIGSLQWGMRQWSELENQMVSVERLLEYTRIETEPKRPNKPDLPKNWPNKGRVEFKDICLRYDETDDMILRNISFLVDSGEKVGIVGRTGAGKSSVISALFQLYDLDGDILIDEINITKIPLNVSRRKISIIPQEPFLFSGTMRKNLDPLGKYSDDFLWRALEQVELKETLSDDNKGLDLMISEGGHNLSAGQRQLVCLARALIQQNKIIIMDEATANVDPYTDALIQKTIRTRFEDCTLLTVAHRLHTVMDSDKILVMRRGKVEEFDHPFVLLRNPEGFLYRLLKASGENTFRSLEQIARNNYEERYGAKYIRVKPFGMSGSERFI